ncbi:hypothetical protein [Legionella drancourtii]|uniref:Outer membrane protein beta-barrel domain-containing protein n=1 Tax=Legionella drancourtii LLAP12 TaxID=658187 RepID=G9ESR3_9GAMM|nr:hypothetical protein [Legionella drancourtii]EHL29744.1 hypothetical protein LDG_8334 [Legionella drancourtii LLAP12]
MEQKIIMGFILLNMTSLTYAYNEANLNPWTVDAAFGMGFYSGMTNHEAQTAVGRLSFGHALVTKPYWQAGIEAGIQSGSTQHLALPKESIDVLGGVPIEAEMKPLLDLLFGLKTEPMTSLPIVAWLKGGVAYRQLQVDHIEVNHLTGFSPEIQVGLGYRANEHTIFNIGYQSIWGKKSELTVNPQTETGILRYIPAQQAVLIGFSYNFL